MANNELGETDSMKLNACFENEIDLSALRNYVGPPCRHYQKNKCIFGRHCWYSHESHNPNKVRKPKPSKYLKSGKIEPFPLQKEGAKAVKFVLQESPNQWPNKKLCVLYMNRGSCSLGECCPEIHGDLCQYCRIHCLHPFNRALREEHQQVCWEKTEQDIEFSFAMQRSQGRECGICREIVLEKKSFSEPKFGIQESCNHVYCLECILKWRNQERKAPCPECRRLSSFVISSYFCVDSEEDKLKLLTECMGLAKETTCLYFRQGSCKFGNLCYYSHPEPRTGPRSEMAPNQDDLLLHHQ